MELDLHGLSVEEATSQILMAFFSFKENTDAQELTVITGQGTKALQTTFLDLIDDEDTLDYRTINNGGSYIVTKK